MAENETEQTEQTQEIQTEQTEEIQTEQTEEVQTEETQETEEAKEETGGGLVARIRAKFSGGDKEDADMTDVPDEFTKVARALNWSDEDTAKFTEDYTNEQLLEMIPSLTGADAAKAYETAETVEKIDEAVETKVEDSQDGEELKQLREDVAYLKEELGVRNEKSKETEQANFNQRASDLFDEASKEFEVFGKTEDLPKFPAEPGEEFGRIIPTSPQVKARLEVYGRAQQLKEAGIPGDEALEISLNAYKGANLKVETQRIAIKGLKEREQTLGGKRSSHKTTEAANLSGPETIAAVKREHGK